MTLKPIFALDPYGSMLPVKADLSSDQSSYKGKNPRTEHYDVVVLMTDGELPKLPPEAAELLKPMLSRGVTMVDFEVIKKFLKTKYGETK